ncbi:hypothetical protein EZV62_022230 [Acer yangbiense]|uniref:CCHC-type domain-containing protein n=1 Tax=Acer yangbiense TaxID=1000413 RepID=A0A5C7H7Y9_9ROSI|nr:hypothetical protein EZV62_022230 [Acer yangbiense]
MVESEIAKLYGKLSLADEDGAIHEMAEEDQRDGEVEVELCLVGKILYGKKVNMDAFKNLIEQLWSQFGSVEVESVGVNIFMFHCNNQEERNRIWQRGPWYFDKSLIVLEKPEGMGNISQLRFDKVKLWIQIHDVPIICMNRRTAKWMAEQIGCVIDLPTETKDCWGKFLKVKVKIDISKPLKRWLRSKLDKSDNIMMVSLKYERLPEFCYVCGRIRHASKDCYDDEAKSNALKSNSKVQSRVFKERSGVNEVGLEKVGNGSLISQVVGLTDSVREPKEDVIGTHTNILSTLSGLGSSQVHGLRLKGPSEETQLNKKKSVVKGKESSGPGLEVKIAPDIFLSSPKKSNTKNWKRLAREKKVEFNLNQQPSLFRNLQTVSTKGKKNSKENASLSTSKSIFNIAGKRSSLGKYQNSFQSSSKERGTLSSSLKRWDVKFGKRKLMIGSVVESGDCLIQYRSSTI